MLIQINLQTSPGGQSVAQDKLEATESKSSPAATERHPREKRETFGVWSKRSLWVLGQETAGPRRAQLIEKLGRVWQ